MAQPATGHGPGILSPNSIQQADIQSGERTCCFVLIKGNEHFQEALPIQCVQ